MAVVLPSNIKYLGDKPNFTRDTFDTLSDMTQAIQDGHIDVGHLSYCKEDGVTYRAIPVTGETVSGSFSTGPIRVDINSDDLSLVRDSASSDSGYYPTSRSIQVLAGDVVVFTPSTTDCSVYICSIYASGNPTELWTSLSEETTIKFPEDTLMFLCSSDASHNFGNDSYSIKHKDTLKWSDDIGDLEDKVDTMIKETEKVVSEAIYDLNNRLGRVEREVKYTDGDPGIPGESTRLDDVWEWYDAQTHIPVLSSTITKTDTGALRQGTSHTYNAKFTWDWANRVDVSGVQTNDGTDWTETMDLTNPKMAGGIMNKTINVTLGTSAKILRAKYIKTDGTDYSGSGSTLTVTPLTPGRTFTRSGLNSSWTSFTSTTTVTMTITATGKNLPVSAKGETVAVGGTTFGTVPDTTDSDWTATNSHTITVASTIPSHTYTWISGGSTLVTTTFSPQPSLILVSPTKSAWNGTASGIASAGINQMWYMYNESTKATTTPEIDFSAGSTCIYLSPLDVRGMTVKSQASGSSDWTTISGFSESGTLSYNGKTYYYKMNPNVGAGKFKFNFS